jgi:hypothetical protein
MFWRRVALLKVLFVSDKSEMTVASSVCRRLLRTRWHAAVATRSLGARDACLPQWRAG